MAVTRRSCLTFLALLLSATTSNAQAPRMVRLPGFLGALPLDSATMIVTIPTTPGAVFWAARQVFSEFRIPVPVSDSAAGTLANPRFVKLRTLAGAPLSTFIACGQGITGPNADTYRVTMAVAAFVEAAGPSAARLRLTLFGGAESPTGSASSAVACASTGVLEDRIANAVKLRARRPPP